MVGTNQNRFDELVSLLMKGEYRITNKARWPISYISARHPALIKNI